MAWPLASRESWARGNHLSDAESASPEAGESNPPISRTGASAQQARGAQPHRSWSLCLCRSASPSHPGKWTPPPLLPLPLGQAGPASLSPLPPPPPHAPSARRIKSRPRPGIQGHQDPPHQPPHQLLHPVPRRLQSPHCSLMSSTHTDHWAFVHAALGPDALPFHPPLSHCCFEASSRVSSIRQYWWRVADMPGAVQGTHEPPDHPDPT